MPPVEQVKNLPPLQGKGLMRDTENENVYRAAYEGKVEYQDGSCELLSYDIQRQFIVGEKYPKMTSTPYFISILL